MSRLTEFEYQIEDFMLFCSAKNLAKRTMQSYEQGLKLFTLYMKNEHDIDDARDVKTTHARQYIQYLKERGKYTIATANIDINYPEKRTDLGKELSPNTINNYVRNIKVFYNFLEDENIVRENPFSRVPFLKKREKIKEALTKTEINTILQNFNLTTFHGYRDYIITKVLLTTGARITETVSLKTEDINIRNRTILFKNTKNKKEKIGYIDGRMLQDLRKWISYKDRYMNTDLLFPTNRGTQLTIHAYGKSLKRTALKGGIENVFPHRLRATFAITFLKNGGSIYVLSRLLDHSSVEVTKVYLNLTDAELREEYMKYRPTINFGGVR